MAIIDNSNSIRLDTNKRKFKTNFNLVLDLQAQKDSSPDKLNSSPEKQKLLHAKKMNLGLFIKRQINDRYPEQREVLAL